MSEMANWRMAAKVVRQVAAVFFSKEKTTFVHEPHHQQNEMTRKEKELRQRLAVLFQQLELYNRYPEEFEKPLGKSGTEEWLNRVLDEIKLIKDALGDSKK